MDITALEAIAPKEPRFTTTLGAALGILRQHLVTFTTLAALVWVPSNLLLQAQHYVMRSHGNQLSVGSALSLIMVLLSSSFAWWLEHAAVNVAVMQHAKGETPSLQSALLPVGRRLGELVHAFGDAMASILLRSLALVVPGIVQMVRCQFVTQVVLFEDCEGKAATARSAQLTNGRKGRVALYLLGVFAVSAAVSQVLAASGLPPRSLGASIIVGMSAMVTGSLVQIAMTLEYAAARRDEPAATVTAQ